MEWIGTISFAASGTLVAVGCGLDLFGVITVGTITAVGGGIMRDLLIGNIPPKIFSNPLILLVAAVTSILVFTVAYFRRKKFQKFRQRVEVVNVFLMRWVWRLFRLQVWKSPVFRHIKTTLFL
jgi:uncharacterized membrane protein YeiH